MYEFAHNFLYDQDTFMGTMFLVFLASPLVGIFALLYSAWKEPRT